MALTDQQAAALAPLADAAIADPTFIPSLIASGKIQAATIKQAKVKQANDASTALAAAEAQRTIADANEALRAVVADAIEAEEAKK